MPKLEIYPPENPTESWPLKISQSGLTITSKTTVERAIFQFDGCHDLTFLGMNFRNCSPFRGKGCTHITLRDCWFDGIAPTMLQQVELHPGNDDWLLERVLFENAPNAIYSRLGEEESANRITIRSCLGRNLYSDDGHFIGIQGGHGHVIEGNESYDTGTAIEFWERSFRPMTNSIVKHNRISRCRNRKNEEGKDTTDGCGIKISGSLDYGTPLPAPGDRGGFVITENEIFDTEGHGISTNIRDWVGIIANIIRDTGRDALHFACPIDMARALLRDNVVRNPKGRFVWCDGMVDAKGNDYTADSNSYFYLAGKIYTRKEWMKDIEGVEP